MALAGAVAAATPVASGCAAEPALGQTTSASTVSGLVDSGCSTAVVLGLARQIADEIDCTHPGALVPFDAGGNITFASSAVLPYLQADALGDLQDVALSHTVLITSAFRTLPQQYLLYQWYLAGSCGITSAAQVGRSNHETARAIDLTAYPLATLAQDGWAHDVPSDDPHFDHTASADLRGADTLGFQHLWNRNHPEDPIDEDGLYGAQTEARLEMAPATGFAQGADCGPPTSGDLAFEPVSIDGPDRVAPQTRAHFTLALANVGTVDWPDTTRLVVADGQSLLQDGSWISGDAITTLGMPVAAGDVAWLDFDVTTPTETADTIVSERLVLDDGGTRFGSVEIALTVTPGSSAPASGDGSEPGSGNTGPKVGALHAGCAAGGGAPGILLALALVFVRRRRPR